MTDKQTIYVEIACSREEWVALSWTHFIYNLTLFHTIFIKLQRKNTLPENSIVNLRIFENFFICVAKSAPSNAFLISFHFILFSINLTEERLSKKKQGKNWLEQILSSFLFEENKYVFWSLKKPVGGRDGRQRKKSTIFFLIGSTSIHNGYLELSWNEFPVFRQTSTWSDTRLGLGPRHRHSYTFEIYWIQIFFINISKLHVTMQWFPVTNTKASPTEACTKRNKSIISIRYREIRHWSH